MHYCLTVDLQGWHPRMDVPRTDALQDQIELSEHAEKAVLRQCLEAGVLPGTHAVDAYTAADTLLFPRFRLAVQRHSFGRNVSDKAMAAVLKKVAGRWDNNGKLFIGKAPNGDSRHVRANQYIFPPLSDARQRFDPHASWPASPADWEFERGFDEELAPYKESGDEAF